MIMTEHQNETLVMNYLFADHECFENSVTVINHQPYQTVFCPAKIET